MTGSFHFNKCLILEERDEGRGGFVLKSRSEAPTRRRRSLSERSLAVKRTILSGLRIKKQHSTGDIHQRATTGIHLHHLSNLQPFYFIDFFIYSKISHEIT